MNSTAVFTAIVAFGIGGYLLRGGGVLLRSTMNFSPHTETLLERGTIALLAAVAISSAVFSGHHLAGFALPLGVLAGGLASWFKTPLALSVILAALITALLRLGGMP